MKRKKTLRRRYGRAAVKLSAKERMALAEARSSSGVRAGHVYSMRTLRALEKKGLLKHVYGSTFESTDVPDVSAMRARELEEMGEILARRGFSPHHALALQEEGMGPEELRGRASIPAHEVGGLTYTHRIKKEKA